MFLNTVIKRISIMAAAVLMTANFSAAAVSADWHKTDEGKYYYTDSDGEKLTGSHKIKGSVYYFDKNGEMHTGWLKKGKSYYYFRADGKRAKGWTKIAGKQYYFLSNGKMAVGNVVIGGKQYTFSSTGVWDGKAGKKLSGAQAILEAAELSPDYFLEDGTDEQGQNSELFAAYWGSDFTAKDADKLLKKKLDSIIKNKETNYEKVKAVYDWIIDNTSYEYGGYGNYLSVDCVINEKIGTCADYSYVFMAMMRYLGYDAVMVNGQTHRADGGYTGHQWVEVTIGGTSYVFDPQVEDNIAGRNNGKIQYQRFCKTYDEVKDKYKK